MKGKNFSVNIQRAKSVLTDLVMSALAFFLFNLFRYDFLLDRCIEYGSLERFLSSTKLILEQVIVPVGMTGVFWLSGYYNKPFDKSRLSELAVTFYSILFCTLAIFLILLINDTTGLRTLDYELILVMFGLLFGFVYGGRAVLTHQTLRKLRRRRWIFSTLIIGNSRKSREVYKKLQESGSVWAYDVVGFIRLDREHQIEDEHSVWDLDEVERVCVGKKVDQIIIAPERIRDAEVMGVLDRLFPLNIPVKIAPDTLSYVTSNIRLNDILGIPFIDLTSPRISEFQKNVKRSFDVIASIFTMIVLSPILLVTAVIVKLTSPGPVIYSQERIGLHRRPFRIYKFRSMREDAESEGPQLSSQTDSRVTTFGRFMRKYRIDELPQFWNVLRGDMSLVGPRPERDFFIQQIVRKAPYYGLIFQIRPGVTSWGMVKYGYASNVEQMVRRSRYDLIYLNNMSISNDVKILIYTVKTVLSGRGM